MVCKIFIGLLFLNIFYINTYAKIPKSKKAYLFLDTIRGSYQIDRAEKDLYMNDYAFRFSFKILNKDSVLVKIYRVDKTGCISAYYLKSRGLFEEYGYLVLRRKGKKDNLKYVKNYTYKTRRISKWTKCED